MRRRLEIRPGHGAALLAVPLLALLTASLVESHARSLAGAGLVAAAGAGVALLSRRGTLPSWTTTLLWAWLVGPAYIYGSVVTATVVVPFVSARMAPSASGADGIPAGARIARVQDAPPGRTTAGERPDYDTFNDEDVMASLVVVGASAIAIALLAYPRGRRAGGSPPSRAR